MKKKVVYIITIIISFFTGVLMMYMVIHFYPNTIIEKIDKKNINIVDEGISESVKKVYDSVVVVENIYKSQLVGSGTGFVYKIKGNDAFIMTNHHVISNAEEVKVVFSNGHEVISTIVGSDEYADIGILKVKKKDIISVAHLGKSADSKLGDTVFTIGVPVGKEFYGTVTRGILSGKDRMVSVSVSGIRNDWIMNVMQTDAAINPGNSGSPLCNVNGEVIGINSLKIVEESIDGLGFSIPIEDALMYANIIEEGKKIERPFIGIQMIDLNNSYELMINGIKNNSEVLQGVVVVNVIENSPASKVHLERGDIIVKIDKNEIKSLAEFRYYLYKYSPQEEIQIEYWRNGKLKKAKIVLEKSE